MSATLNKENSAAVQNKKRRKQSMFKIICKRLSKNPTAMAGLVIILILVFLAIFAPLIAPYSPTEMDYTAINGLPSAKHIMGCDAFGRDIFSRLLYGAKYSLSLGILCSLIGMVFGLFFGCIVGYIGGTTDMVVMRICDVLSAVPPTLLAILISTALGGGFFQTVIAMTVGGIPGSIRGSRAMCLKEREMEYLEAAKAMNCSRLKIIFKHMMPNVISPTIVGTTMHIGSSIMQAAGLAYIGLGIQPPTPEWGAMLSAAKASILDYPHMMIFPGLAIAVTVLAINMFGDGLRDAMDPKLKD